MHDIFDLHCDDRYNNFKSVTKTTRKMSTSNDGSESVDHFLARIASVKEKDEAAAATRRMDEEFLKGRQERQARRLGKSDLNHTAGATGG